MVEFASTSSSNSLNPEVQLRRDQSAFRLRVQNALPLTSRDYTNAEQKDLHYRLEARKAQSLANNRPYQYSAPTIDDMQQSLENEDDSQEEDEFQEAALLRTQEETEESEGKLTLARNAIKRVKETAQDKMIEKGIEEAKTMVQKAVLNGAGDAGAAIDSGVPFLKIVETLGISIFGAQVAYTFLQGFVPEQMQTALKKHGIEPLSLSKALDVGISFAGIALVIKWFAVAIIIIAIFIIIIAMIQNASTICGGITTFTGSSLPAMINPLCHL